jgi:NSS family neurotransmitter:Na+ symporter
MTTTSTSRGTWGSRLGFVLAAAGSAIGLGNIWKFPIETGENGGAAFVFVYLICVLSIGIPVMITELAVGRKTGSNPVGAFKKLMPGSAWKMVGGLGVVTGLMILSAYAVVAGWILKYIWFAVSGTLSGKGADEIGAIFTASTSSGWQSIMLLLFFLVLTAGVVVGGVQGGIERASKTLMPVLLVLLLLLCIRSVTLPGAGAGVSFYLKPDFSKIDFDVVMAALGQAFFSLSLGMGTMITYGSYLRKDDNLATSAAAVCLLDSAVAIIAGFMIFPALFAGGVDPQAGPGLIFVVLPHIFNNIPFGQLFSAFFFFLVAIAALTSTISLLEVPVAYFVDERGWSRKKAAWLVTLGAFIIGTPSALSNGAVAALTNFRSGFMGEVFNWFGEFSLVVGGLAICIFVGYRWGLKPAIEEIRQGSAEFFASGLWGFMIRYGCPAAIAGILVSKYILPMFE